MKLKLREIRKIRDKSQKDVCKEVGCSSTVYSRYETGSREPSLEMLSTLADYYEVSTDYLLGREPVEQASLSEYEALLIEASRSVSSNVREDVLDFMILKIAKEKEKYKNSKQQ